MSHKNTLTFPSSYHKIAWFRDNTLQSKIQLFVAGLLFATERPIFTGSVKGTLLSSKGWELGREVKIAIAILLHSCCSSRRLKVREKLTTIAHEHFELSSCNHVIITLLSPPLRKSFGHNFQVFEHVTSLASFVVYGFQNVMFGRVRETYYIIYSRQYNNTKKKTKEKKCKKKKFTGASHFYTQISRTELFVSGTVLILAFCLKL